MTILKNLKDGHAVARDLTTNIAYAYDVQTYNLINPNQPERMIPVYEITKDGTVDYDNEQAVSNKKLKDEWIKIL